MRTSGFIYLWNNKINNMKYIGKCWGDPSSSYIGSGKYFRRAVKKFGIENFERSILEYCLTKEELKNREQHWINHFNAAHNDQFYNISPNAGGGHHGADYNGEKNPMWGKKHPNHKPHCGKENGMYGIHRFLSENPNAKKYYIIDNEGKEVYTNCLKEFVKDRFGEHYEKIYQSLKEQALRATFKPATKGHCKGWKIKHDVGI
jgi:hypothetical protein